MKITMVQALNQALAQEMARDERHVLLGEDVGPSSASRTGSSRSSVRSASSTLRWPNPG